jgi:hypothetical protein
MTRAHGSRGTVVRMSTDSALRRARDYVDASIFPEAPSPPHLSWRRTLVCAGLALLAVAVQMIRMWSSVPLDSIWAEDGSTWIADATTRGVTDALTTTYNGYLQTVSRLVAEPIATLPPETFAPAMATSGAAIVTGCAFVVWRASSGHISSPYLRGALATLVVLLPVVGFETLDNVTNSIWFLLFASFWLLLWRPSTFARAAGGAAVIFLTVLSNAGMFVFAPLWVLRLFAVRDSRDGVIVMSYAAGSAIQLAFSWDAPIRGEGDVTLSPRAAEALMPHWDWSLVPAYAQRVIGGAFTGQDVTGYLWKSLGTGLEIALFAALIGLAVFALATNWRRGLVVILFLGASCALFLISGYERWLFIGQQLRWPHGTYNSDHAHYMVAPTLLLLSGLFVQLDSRPRIASAVAWARVQASVVAFVFATALVSFSVGDSRYRGKPTWSESLDNARASCRATPAAEAEVPVSPEAFAFNLPIACSELIDSPPSGP